MTKNQLYWAGGVGLVVLSLVALLFFVVEQSLHAVDNSSHPTSPVLSNTSSSSQSTSRANSTGIKAPTQFLDALLTTAPQQHVSPAPTECMLPYQHIGDAHLSDRQLADRFNAASDGVNYQLSASNDPELLMVAAMYEDDPEAGVALAEQAVAMAPNNALVLWNAVMDCHDPNLCPSLDWLEQLSKVDSDNADVWMSLAVEQMRLGDEASALDSLQQAATSSSHNIYFADTIEMGVRAFAAAGSDLPFHVVAGYAFGVSAQKLPQYGGYAKLCQTLSKDNAIAAEHCLHYAQNSQVHSKARIAQNMAADIEVIALQQMGYAEQAAALSDQNQQALTIATEAHFGSAQQTQNIEAYIAHSPGNLQSYMDLYRSQGELAAWQQIEQEKLEFERQYLSDNCQSMMLGGF